ncbi:hypothetical protein [Epilithonimonas hungarica]|uniref:Uncharacterized protein n=1 Tax=Epilithonimonas hungarica TaxID=454006 RepID=A0A1G7H4G7_9FLAO|nr:hypothetical protein [Epilithonimonas hungarica]MDP9956634.1 hypothetical protein [Epilithonimonas hungarica]SDE95330.1 hypothetical protein SAMN05421825_0683 [Epilithonimonas hungarica]
MRSSLLILLFPLFFFPQKTIRLDSLQLIDTAELLGDDYGNIYLYKKKDLSLAKYDTTGKQLGKVMMTFPYKTQSVTNPLNIVMFSENAQEIKFLDQNLNEIQKINLNNNFGFIKAVYSEDLQFAWLVDDSNKTLVQYNFRSNSVINSFPFNINLQSLLDFLVYNNKIYILRENTFEVYNTKASLLYSANVTNPRKLRRANDDILIFEAQSIKKFDGRSLSEIFQNQNAKIVDKNNSGFLALIKDKLYLYKNN